MSKRTKIIIASALLCIAAAIIGFAATTYSSAKILFSGMRLVRVEDPNDGKLYTQGLVDVSIQNLNTTSLSFCLEYNSDYIELSDATDNTLITNVTADAGSSQSATYNLEHKYFDQNTDLFPDGSDASGDPNVFFDSPDPATIGYLPIIGIADPQNKHIIMNFIPTDTAAKSSKYTGMTDAPIQDIHIDSASYPTIMAYDANASKTVKLGTLSFRIKDDKLKELTQLSSDQLSGKVSGQEDKALIRVVEFSEMLDIERVVNPMIASDGGVNISYTDDNGDYQWYSDKEGNINVDIKLETDLDNVIPMKDEIETTSYEIYKDGSVSDLYAFLNERMSMIRLVYSDGSEIPAVFEWDEHNATISATNMSGATVSNSWDVKGGKIYTITQPYNEDIDISVQVTVYPVNLVGYKVDKEYDSYVYNLTDPTQNTDYPTELADLELPEKAQVVFDRYIPNYGFSDVRIDSYIYNTQGVSDLPDDIRNGVAGTYNFTAMLNSDDTNYSTKYPWLTVNVAQPPVVRRDVVNDESNKNKELNVSATVDDTTGAMTIDAAYTDASTIWSGSIFTIRLPNGLEYQSDSAFIQYLKNENKYSETFNGDGSVTLVLAPDINSTNSTYGAEEKALAQLINLGNRAGNFALKVQDTGGSITPFTPFATDPRKNVYTETSYTYDYSGMNSSLLPIQRCLTVDSIPRTITLPLPSDAISTTYSGYDGSEPGGLITFTVDSNGWSTSDNTYAAGTVVTITGTLDSTTYTNYGYVENDKNSTVSIKYYVLSDTSADTIEPISDYVYSAQQVGYGHDKLETHQFVIKNLGNAQLDNLSVMIEPSDTTVTDAYPQSKQAFSLSLPPVPLVSKNGQTVFDITTMPDLPLEDGKDQSVYKSKVTVYSNNAALTSFYVTFTVTKAPMYAITLVTDPEDESFGTAKTDNDLYTSEANKTITIVAEPEDECAFVEWQLVSGPTGFTIDDLASATSATTTFTMPEGDVKLKAVFKETKGALLRVSELIVKDKDGNTQKLCDDDWNEVDPFDPTTRTYNVAIPNSSDSVDLWFIPREEIQDDTNVTYNVTLEYDPDTDSAGEVDQTVPAKDTTDNYYKTTGISPINLAPTVNKVRLKITYDDPNDSEEAIERVYTINVYRKLSLDDMIKFNYGNSPYGLIMRDSSLNPVLAKTAFDDNDFTFKGIYTPSGGIDGTHYSEKAWETQNYDRNDKALFVIKPDAFTDPGYDGTVLNSIGEAVNASDVKKKVVVQELTTGAANQDGSSDDFVHIQSKEVELPITGSITELQSIRIRPDKYGLIYYFTDYDGSTTIEIERPLIVLYQLGDVNASSSVTSEDSRRITERFHADIANNLNVQDGSVPYKTGGRLFKYRVCDTNKDGNLNAVDANNINANELSPFYANYTGGGS